jgi:hypothetical protein
MNSKPKMVKIPAWYSGENSRSFRSGVGSVKVKPARYTSTNRMAYNPKKAVQRSRGVSPNRGSPWR